VHIAITFRHFKKNWQPQDLAVLLISVFCFSPDIKKNSALSFDALVKSQIRMAKKKVPPILKLARRANPE
jgi:hypothetical protein